MRPEHAPFDDSILATPLDRESALAVLVLAGAVRSPLVAERALTFARDHGLGAGTALEMALESYLFAGFPRCISALAAYRRVYGPTAEGSARRTIGAEDIARWRKRGAALFRRIYAANTDRVLADLDAFHPELADWILVDAYGKVLARPGADARLRELAAVGALIVSGDSRQFTSHMRGAVHCGASAAETAAVIDLVERLAAPESVAEARAAAARVL